MIKFVSLSWFLWLYHFYGLFTAYLLFEEVMSIRLYVGYAWGTCKDLWSFLVTLWMSDARKFVISTTVFTILSNTCKIRYWQISVSNHTLRAIPIQIQQWRHWDTTGGSDTQGRAAQIFVSGTYLVIARCGCFNYTDVDSFYFESATK